VYVIITSRPGEYRTEPGEHMDRVEQWDYTLEGRLRAQFAIARLDRETRVRIIEETAGGTVNLVSTRFLEKHASIEAARTALAELARFGTLDATLVRRDVSNDSGSLATP
jgi:hypothetical protein